MGVTSLGAAEPTRGRFRLATPGTAVVLGALALLLLAAAAPLADLAHQLSFTALGPNLIVPGFVLVGAVVAAADRAIRSAGRSSARAPSSPS